MKLTLSARNGGAPGSAMKVCLVVLVIIVRTFMTMINDVTLSLWNRTLGRWMSKSPPRVMTKMMALTTRIVRKKACGRQGVNRVNMSSIEVQYEVTQLIVEKSIWNRDLNTRMGRELNKDIAIVSITNLAVLRITITYNLPTKMWSPLDSVGP